MFKVLTSDFMENPPLEMNITEQTDEIELYGKKYRMYHDPWKHHIHLKCTNACDANCKFCIERSSRDDRENPNAFMESMTEVVNQMKEQDQFSTLSVTGGEPTLFCKFREVLEFAHEVQPMLFSINSNGCNMNSDWLSGYFHGWFNLSKHRIDDGDIFQRKLVIFKEDIIKFKRANPLCKVRIQCVLGMQNGFQSISNIVSFIDYYKSVVDDFSFRSLIIEDGRGNVPILFRNFRSWMMEQGMCTEQVIQDYYVYENYNVLGTPVVISWSNMALLQKFNETHPDNNFLEEIIVHPDGTVSGSWNKKTLIIKPSPFGG